MTASASIPINKYLPIAVLYFFFNSFLLPLGLLYTTILTPFFIVWLARYPSFKYLGIFFIVTLPFLIIHVMVGVDLLVYLKSYLLLFSTFVFGLSFYQFLKNSSSTASLFRSVTIINIFFVVLAIACYFISPIRDYFWYTNKFTSGISNFYRLKLFTYEASYYSFLLIPIVLYYYLKMIFLPFPNKVFVFLIITIPILLSLSFGVMTCLILTLIFLFSSDIRLLFINQKIPGYIIGIFVFLLITLFIVIQFFPDNALFTRIENIFSGKDTSFRGRTFDSFYLGWKLAAQKNIFFGCGAGQIKVLGTDLFNQFYVNNYTPDELTIPNSIGDLLAQYGLLGLGLKLFLEVFFFFKTRVYSNIYRLSLFLFIFLYQFTGSFITNIAEYVIWILAFYPPLFPGFNKTNILPIGLLKKLRTVPQSS